MYLVQPTSGRRGKVRQRILYWYRTPPNVKVGRDPFDSEARREIERLHPDLQFDWEALLATPKPAPPSADVERWRERRRQMKAQRAATAEPEPAEDLEPAGGLEEAGAVADELVASADAQVPTTVEAAAAQAPAGEQSLKKRRRRRRRGRRSGDAAPVQPGAAGETAGEAGVEAESTEAEPSDSAEEQTPTDATASGPSDHDQ